MTVTSYVYAQDTGAMFDVRGVLLHRGYSGNHTGLNNPADEDVRAVGPLPCGLYTIGPARNPIDHLGPIALPLMPAVTNEMFGRSAFFIHGDNAAGNHSASDGCIIMPPDVRATIDRGYVRQLQVVATEVEAHGMFTSAA
jgi:hypothetical protein